MFMHDICKIYKELYILDGFTVSKCFTVIVIVKIELTHLTYFRPVKLFASLLEEPRSVLEENSSFNFTPC